VKNGTTNNARYTVVFDQENINTQTQKKKSGNYCT
jgi:hypothetical protein